MQSAKLIYHFVSAMQCFAFFPLLFFSFCCFRYRCNESLINCSISYCSLYLWLFWDKILRHIIIPITLNLQNLYLLLAVWLTSRRCNKFINDLNKSENKRMMRCCKFSKKKKFGGASTQCLNRFIKPSKDHILAQMNKII